MASGRDTHPFAFHHCWRPLAAHGENKEDESDVMSMGKVMGMKSMRHSRATVAFRHGDRLVAGKLCFHDAWPASDADGQVSICMFCHDMRDQCGFQAAALCVYRCACFEVRHTCRVVPWVRRC